MPRPKSQTIESQNNASSRDMKLPAIPSLVRRLVRLYRSAATQILLRRAKDLGFRAEDLVRAFFEDAGALFANGRGGPSLGCRPVARHRPRQAFPALPVRLSPERNWTAGILLALFRSIA